MHGPAHHTSLLVVAILSMACSSKPTAGGTSSTGAPEADAACARAATLRTRAAGLRSEGKLDRARRVLERAAGLCPASAPPGWAELLTLDAELGARTEGLALAAEVERAPAAPQAAKDAAAGLRKAFAAPAPDGEHLLETGLRDLAAGKRAEAQRALDRGRVALEQAAGKVMRVTARGALSGPVAHHAWRDDSGALAIAHGRFVTVIPMDPAAEPRTLTGHEGAVQSILWTHRGERILSASSDGAVLLRSAATGAVEKRWALGAGDVGVAISADDRLIAAGAGGDHRARVFRVEDGARVMEAEVERVSALGFVAGREELWVDSLSTIVWWDLRTGRTIHEMSPGDSPRAVAPNGRDVVVVQNEHELTLRSGYGSVAGPVLATAPGCEAHLFPSFFTPDGKTLVASRTDGVALALALPGGRPRWKRPGKPEVSTVSGDASLIAEAAPGVVVVRDAATGTAKITLTTTRVPRSLDFSPDGKHLIALSGRSGVETWSLTQAAPQRTLGHAEGAVVALGAGGGRLAVMRERSLSTLSPRQPRDVWSAPEKAPRGAVINTGGALAALSDEEEVRFWDLADRRARGVVAAKEHHRLLPSADAAAVNAVEGNSFILRRAPGGAADRPIPALWHRSAFSADGRVLVAVTEGDGRVGVWDVATGAARCVLGTPKGKYEPWPEDVAVSRDGSRFVSIWKDELRIHAGCGDSAPRVVPTAWSGRPAGTSALSDDGKFVFFLKDMGPTWIVWKVDDGTRTEIEDPRFRRFTKGPGAEVLLWSDTGAMVWSPDQPPRPVAVSGVEAVAWVGPRLLLGGNDGDVALMSPGDGKTLGTVSLLGSGPASIAVADADAGGATLFEVFGDPGDTLRCELGGRSYPIDACRERLEVMGLLDGALSGDERYLEP